jgi:methyl-accepting chemotaxis protein
MSDHDQRNSLGLLILAGIGAGALTGTLLGLLASRRPRAQARDEIGETVDDLKRRAEQILAELSQTQAASAEMASPEMPSLEMPSPR